MFKNDEELILGYLLEALDEHESHEITERLHKDEDFRRKYNKLTAAYSPAMAARDEEWENLEPPRGLTERTIDFIVKNAPRASKTAEFEQHVPVSAALTQVHQAVSASSLINAGLESQNTYSSGGFEPELPLEAPAEAGVSPQMSETVTGRLRETRVSNKNALSPASLMPEAEKPQPEMSSPAASPGMSEQPESGRRSRFRVWDMAIAVCILGVVSFMLIQAVTLTREQTRIESCRGNMMLLGRAMQQYSALHGGFFPGVHQVENRDHQMAGIYGPLLLEKEFISPKCLFCPSASHGNVPAVPRYSQLAGAGGGESSAGHVRRLGGDYAYNIGYTENGEYRPVKNLGRSHYVLLADAPLKTEACRNACDVELPPRESMAHGKHGMNVLYEDGHVALLARPEITRADGSVDMLFRNDAGEMAPGVGPEDVVLGASELRVPVVRK